MQATSGEFWVGLLEQRLKSSVRMMVDHDLELAMQKDTLKRAGHSYLSRRHAELGFTARTPLEGRLKQTYQWFVTSGAASEMAVKT